MELTKKMSAVATLHCLTGCAIGEVLGMVLGTAMGLSNIATIILAVALAFLFGYTFTLFPLVRGGFSLKAAAALAFAADTVSIAVMEIVDNGVMILVPGAMDAHLTSTLFWTALAFALFVAFLFAWPVNHYLIRRGKGHALVHEHHGHHHHEHHGHHHHDHTGHDHAGHKHHGHGHSEQ